MASFLPGISLALGLPPCRWLSLSSDLAWITTRVSWWSPSHHPCCHRVNLTEAPTHFLFSSAGGFTREKLYPFPGYIRIPKTCPCLFLPYQSPSTPPLPVRAVIVDSSHKPYPAGPFTWEPSHLPWPDWYSFSSYFQVGLGTLCGTPPLPCGLILHPQLSSVPWALFLAGQASAHPPSLYLLPAPVTSGCTGLKKKLPLHTSCTVYLFNNKDCSLMIKVHILSGD